MSTFQSTQEKPRLSAVLAQVATIASVRTTSLGMNRLDKRASARSDRMHNALSGAGKTTVNRMAGAEDKIKEINSVAAEISATIRAHTTDFNGKRLLANAMIQETLAAYAPLKAKWDALVASFIDNAPRYIADAEQNVGDYDVAPPTLDEVKKAFSLEFDMSQIPDSETFSASGMDKAIEKELKRRFEASIEAAYQNATNDALKRVATPIKNLAEKMHAYSERESLKDRGFTVDKSGTFKDTLTTNVDEIAKVFRAFNLTGDKFMNDLADQLDALTGIDANDLRNDAGLRADTEKRANAILESLKDLL